MILAEEKQHMEENRRILSAEECESISGGGPTQWNEVQDYIRKYIRAHCPEAVHDPQNIHDGEVAKFMAENLPGYNMASIGKVEERENHYFFSSEKRILSHAEFMEYLRTTLPM